MRKSNLILKHSQIHKLDTIGVIQRIRTHVTPSLEVARYLMYDPIARISMKLHETFTGQKTKCLPAVEASDANDVHQRENGTKSCYIIFLCSILKHLHYLEIVPRQLYRHNMSHNYRLIYFAIWKNLKTKDSKLGQHSEKNSKIVKISMLVKFLRIKMVPKLLEDFFGFVCISS